MIAVAAARPSAGAATLRLTSIAVVRHHEGSSSVIVDVVAAARPSAGAATLRVGVRERASETR
eukprot:1734333-Prymnesium_polylepis.1